MKTRTAYRIYVSKLQKWDNLINTCKGMVIERNARKECAKAFTKAREVYAAAGKKIKQLS